ncbi:MAG: FISUMP domain-containing protein [archaeon]
MSIPVSAFISALPGGYRNNNGTYNNIGNNGNWWSATENNSNNAWNRNLNYNNSDVNRNNNNKQNGFSVRCVGDLLRLIRA